MGAYIYDVQLYILLHPGEKAPQREASNGLGDRPSAGLGRCPCVGLGRWLPGGLMSSRDVKEF